MVSRETTPEELDRQIRQLKADIEELKKLYNHHVGNQIGASSSNTPHPTMSAVSRGLYTVTNGTADRTYNADTVLVAELADIVYTIIEDLKAVKILG